MPTKDEYRLMKLQEKYDMPNATEAQIGDEAYRRANILIKETLCK